MALVHVRSVGLACSIPGLLMWGWLVIVMQPQHYLSRLALSSCSCCRCLLWSIGDCAIGAVWICELHYTAIAFSPLQSQFYSFWFSTVGAVCWCCRPHGASYFCGWPQQPRNPGRIKYITLFDKVLVSLYCCYRFRTLVALENTVSMSDYQW